MFEFLRIFFFSMQNVRVSNFSKINSRKMAQKIESEG